MTSIILVESSGTLKSLKAKDLSVDTLYRKAGYRSADHFEKRHVWVCKLDQEQEVSVALYAKTTGKALHENKYNFPPPVESDLYFGTVILVQVASDGQLVNLEIPTWNAVYDKLFAGFENLGDNDSEEDNIDPEDEDDEEEDGPTTQTKNHLYVSSDETDPDEEEEDEDGENESEDEEEGIGRKKRKTQRKPRNTGAKSKSRNQKSVEKKIPAVMESAILVVSELEEELYCYSDEN